MKSEVFFLIFLITAHQGYSQEEGGNLLCYYCDYQHNPEGCSDPARNNVQQLNCEEEFHKEAVNSTLICWSASITFSGDQKNFTGVYRGCQLETISGVPFCDWLKQLTDNQKGQLESCVPCKNSLCNSVTFDENGQPKSSSNALNKGLIALLVTVLFSALF